MREKQNERKRPESERSDGYEPSSLVILYVMMHVARDCAHTSDRVVMCIYIRYVCQEKSKSKKKMRKATDDELFRRGTGGRGQRSMWGYRAGAACMYPRGPF